MLAGAITLNGGTLRGSGQTGSIVNSGGTVAPGSSPGTLTVNGNYTQGAGGTLAEEIGGTTPGSQFDVLAIKSGSGGHVTLGGTLAIDSAGYTPSATDTFKIIGGAAPPLSGSFATVTGATFGGATYSPRYDTAGVTLLVTTS